MTKFHTELNNQKFEISYNSNNLLFLDGKNYEIKLKHLEEDVYSVQVNNKTYKIFINEIKNGKFQSLINGESFEVSLETDLEREANKILNKNFTTNSRKNIKAPMNGLIIKINKIVGDTVEIGESLIVLEAMKMENEIKSASEGIIKKSNCHIGKSVERDELLFVIE